MVGVPVFGGKSLMREVYFADHKSASQNGPQKPGNEDRQPGSEALPPETGSVRSGIYLDPQKAEFGSAEGRQGAFDQRHGSDDLYPRSGA